MWKSDKVWKIGGFKYKSLQKYVYIQTYRTVHEHLGRAMPSLLLCDSSTDSYEQIYKNDLLMCFIITVSAAFYLWMQTIVFFGILGYCTIQIEL